MGWWKIIRQKNWIKLIPPKILNSKTQKLDHKIKFNGNTILLRQYNQNEVFTGELMVYISDQWHNSVDKYRVRNFIYENLD